MIQKRHLKNDPSAEFMVKNLSSHPPVQTVLRWTLFPRVTAESRDTQGVQRNPPNAGLQVIFAQQDLWILPMCLTWLPIQRGSNPVFPEIVTFSIFYISSHQKQTNESPREYKAVRFTADQREHHSHAPFLQLPANPSPVSQESLSTTVPRLATLLHPIISSWPSCNHRSLFLFWSISFFKQQQQQQK